MIIQILPSLYRKKGYDAYHVIEKTFSFDDRPKSFENFTVLY